MLIAVAPRKRVTGVDPSKGPSDWRCPLGSPANIRRVEASWRVMHVDGAMRERHATDAHFVAYVVRQGGQPLMRQPRVNKDGLEWMRAEGYELTLEGLVADVDNPGHTPWASREEARLGVHRAKARVPTAIVYASRAGLRIIQPIRQRLVPEQAEGALAAWLGQLEHAGLVADRGCLDWTRLFRLPHVARDGGPLEDAPAISLTFATIEAPAPIRALRRGTKRVGAAAVPAAISWSRELPPHLAGLVAPIAAALSTVPEGWHDTHLAIAGALAKGGVDPAHLPELAGAIAAATADTRPDDRRTAAETTARRYLAGGEVRGMRWLTQHAPAVAQVLEQLVGRGPAAPSRPPPPPPPTDQPEVVRLQVEGAVRRASERLSLVVVPPGTGKTRALRTVAAERAMLPRSEGSARAPLGSRTAISVPMHELAEQIVRDLDRAGVTAARLVGLASYREDGQLVCAYAAQAGALAGGGLSVRVELCEGRGRRCPHYDECPARGGMIGPEDARVVVGPHALVAQLDELAGKTGLLAIDEPPALLRTERIRLEDIDHALGHLHVVSERYAAGVRPALLAVRAWLAAGEEAPPGPLSRAWAAGVDAGALEAAFEALGATTLEEAAELAVDPMAKSEAPPLTQEAAFAARLSLGVAQSTAKATRVMRDVRMAVLRTPEGERRGIGTIERTGTGEPVLVLTLVAEALRRACRREGAVVVLAADADLHAPMLAQAVGYEPEVLRVAARWGAPVRRVLLEAPASRTRWLRDGKVQRRAVLEALRAGVAELERDGVRRALVVTWAAVEAVLERDPEAQALLAMVGGELAHYGGLRGLDRWSDVGGVLTLGDPRPNLGDIVREVAILGSGDVATRLDELAAAEVEQAHGRARLVHRGADRPCTLVHVGTVMPRGWCAPVEVRPMGTSQTGEGLREAVARVGGTAAAARLMGTTPGSVRRWMHGARGPPEDALRRITEAGCGARHGEEGRRSDPFC